MNFMNNITRSIKFIYELVKFIVLSIPLALFLFVTLTLISKFKNI